MSTWDRSAAWRLAVGGAVTSMLAAAATPVGAQDVEVAAEVLGHPLPQAYYDRVDRDPTAFSLEGGWIARARLAAASGKPLTGAFPLLVVPALFADSPEPTVSREEIQRILFDGPSAAGTMTEFYEVSSRGMFTVRGTVAPWVRTSLTVAEVRAGSFGLGEDARTGDFLVEALTRADETVDYALFDNDGPDGIPNSGDDDGVVDALAVEFLESAITCQGQGPTIWAHRSRVDTWQDGPFVSADMGANGEPIQANDYVVQAGESCIGTPQSAGVIVHEFGHALGLPDLYDQTEGVLPEQRNWVIGCWSIMAAGQWGCGPALAQGRWDRPTHFSPWEKDELGWLPDLVTAGEVLDAEFTLRPVESSGEVLRVDLSPTEYLYIEYRDGSGFDVNLPGTGILVYHVDLTRLTGSRRCRGCPQIYRVSLLEADHDHSLIIPEGDGGSRGEAGDIFGPGTVHRLTNATLPSSRLNSGAASDVTIREMEVADGVARIRLSTRTLPLDALLEPFFTGTPGPLTGEEREYLDRLGNGDGAFDLGDLSLYLREHPSVVARRGS